MAHVTVLSLCVYASDQYWFSALPASLAAPYALSVVWHFSCASTCTFYVQQVWWKSSHLVVPKINVGLSNCLVCLNYSVWDVSCVFYCGSSSCGIIPAAFRSTYSYRTVAWTFKRAKSVLTNIHKVPAGDHEIKLSQDKNKNVVKLVIHVLKQSCNSVFDPSSGSNVTFSCGERRAIQLRSARLEAPDFFRNYSPLMVWK